MFGKGSMSSSPISRRCFLQPNVLPVHSCRRKLVPARHSRTLAIEVKENDNANAEAEAERTTKKWGLEVGLFKALTSKDADPAVKGQTAKELLKRYGSAYLATSISFAIVSFAACYALVASGIDVRSLLSNLGLQVGDTGERVGTFAIAYAAHKALSPVRFPPTVAMTPIVARWLGKEKKQNDE